MRTRQYLTGRMGILLIGGLVSAVLSGCANTELDASHAGTTQTFAVGECFDVRLRTNGSTGYSWEVVIADPTVVAMVDSEIDPDGGAEGAGGEQRFVFECATEGSSRIDMAHVPPGDGPIAETFDLTVVCVP